MARRGALRRHLTVLAVIGAAAATAAGCATVPSGGAPQEVKGRSGQVQAYVLPLAPPPPRSNWSPEEVVLGFLHASASFAIDPSAARHYLAPSLRNSWQPGAVTVVAPPGPGDFQLQKIPSNTASTNQPTVLIRVSFTGQRIAALSDSGQYLYAPGSSPYTFTLAKDNGIWLITQLPPGVLLLTQADFQDVYQPRNLYFFTPSGELVPDPVFVPLQAGASAPSASLATGLVNGLLSDRGSWLSNATTTAFPPGTKLLGPVTVDNLNAHVNLGGAAVSRAPKSVIQAMGDQLQATLTLSPYSAPVAKSISLSINGKPQYLFTQLPIATVASASGDAPVFIRSGPSSISQLEPKARSPQTVLLPAQIGQAVISAITASPNGGAQLAVAATAASGRGCTVYIGRAGSQAPYQGYQLSNSGSRCSAVSWDNNGNIWAAAGDKIWMLRQGDRRPFPVSPPVLPGISQPSSRILALRMAPDGVRAALLVQTQAGNRVLLAAVSYHSSQVTFGPPVAAGSGLIQPLALSWLDPYHLAILANSAVYAVPLTGGAGQQLGPVPPGADSLTTNGSQLVIGTDQNQVWASPASASNWTKAADEGTIPAFPG